MCERCASPSHMAMAMVIMVKALSIGAMHEVSAMIRTLKNCSFPKIRTTCPPSCASVRRRRGSDAAGWPGARGAFPYHAHHRDPRRALGQRAEAHEDEQHVRAIPPACVWGAQVLRVWICCRRLVDACSGSASGLCVRLGIGSDRNMEHGMVLTTVAWLWRPPLTSLQQSL